MLIPHLQQKHTHRRGKKSPLICWAFFPSHYRQSSNVCNTLLVCATKEYKRGFETSPFAVSFAQIRARDSKPECIYAVHRRCRGRHHKKAQSGLINCSLSATVFRFAQFSGKIWELNVEAKRIPTVLLPTHWNASKARAPSWKTLSFLTPAQWRAQPRLATGSQESLWTPKQYLEVLLGHSHPLQGWGRLIAAQAALVFSSLWTARKGETSPLSPLSHTLLKQSPEAATFGSSLLCRMKAHFVWVHWHFITEEVRGTNRKVISIHTQSCFK